MNTVFTTLLVPALAVLLAMSYLYYLIWQKIKEPHVVEEDEEFLFPEANTLTINIDHQSFVGEVVAKSYMDDTPTLVLKGLINRNTLSYLYLFGEEAIEEAMLSETTLSQSQKNFITRITPQQSAVNYFDGGNFIPLEDEKALEETRVQLHIMEEAPKEEGTYDYSYDASEETLHIEKEQITWQTLPLCLFENTLERALPWRYIFAIFALLLTSLSLFRLDPILSLKDSFSVGVVSLAFITYVVMTVYMFIAYLLNRNYIVMFFAPIYAVVLVFMTFPFVLSAYALLFGLNQSTFSITIEGYKSPYIKVKNENGYSKLKTDYGWFALQHENNATTWEFKEGYLDLPFEMQQEVSGEDQVAIDDAVKRLNVLEPQDGDGSLCHLRPCRVVTHHEVYETIKITGTTAFGSYVADSVRVVERAEKEAPYDRYTYTLYPKETLASLPAANVKEVKSVTSVPIQNDENVTRYDLVVNQCMYAHRDENNTIVMGLGLFNLRDAKLLTPMYNLKAYIPITTGYMTSQKSKDGLLQLVKQVDAKSTVARKLSSGIIYMLSTSDDYQLHIELEKRGGSLTDVKILNHMQKPCPDIDLAIGDTLNITHHRVDENVTK